MIFDQDHILILIFYPEESDLDFYSVPDQDQHIESDLRSISWSQSFTLKIVIFEQLWLELLK